MLYLWYMKKLVKPAFFIGFWLLPAIFCATAQAASLPPGNPFYPFQKGVWQLRRTFTFNPVAKALLEMRLANDRMADAIRTVTRSADESEIVAALTAYDDELNAFIGAAQAVGDEAVIVGVAPMFISHMAFFDDMLEHSAVAASADARALIAASRQSLMAYALQLFEKGHGNIFRMHMRAAVQGSMGGIKELRAAEALTALIGKTMSAEPVKQMVWGREDMLFSFMGKAKRDQGAFEKIEKIAGDRATRLEALDAARSLTADMDMRNALMLVRTRIAEKAEAGRAITPTVVREALNHAKAISAAFSLVSDEQAYFTEQAEKFFTEGAYALSFQHALSARAAALNSLLEKTMSKDDMRQEIAVVKEIYDRSKIKNAAIEKKIAAIADMGARVSAKEIIALLRDVKLALAFSDN